jgi:hypothetical protein
MIGRCSTIAVAAPIVPHLSIRCERLCPPQNPPNEDVAHAERPANGSTPRPAVAGLMAIALDSSTYLGVFSYNSCDPKKFVLRRGRQSFVSAERQLRVFNFRL